MQAPLHGSAVEAVALSPTLQSLRLGRFAQPALPDLPPGALPALTRLRLSVAPELQELPASWCRALAPSLVCLEVREAGGDGRPGVKGARQGSAGASAASRGQCVAQIC